MWRSSNYTSFCKIDLSFCFFCLFKTFNVYQRAKVKLPVTSSICTSSHSGKVSMLNALQIRSYLNNQIINFVDCDHLLLATWGHSFRFNTIEKTTSSWPSDHSIYTFHRTFLPSVETAKSSVQILLCKTIEENSIICMLLVCVYKSSMSSQKYSVLRLKTFELYYNVNKYNTCVYTKNITWFYFFSFFDYRIQQCENLLLAGRKGNLKFSFTEICGKKMYSNIKNF